MSQNLIFLISQTLERLHKIKKMEKLKSGDLKKYHQQRGNSQEG